MAYGDTRGQGDRYATTDERVATCPIACIGSGADCAQSAADRTRAAATLAKLLPQALADVAAQARIVLESEAGMVVVFLTDAAQCLAFGLALRDAVQACSEPSLRLRMGMHVGPVRVAQSDRGEPRFDGEGLEAGWRIVSHAAGGRITVSASFLHAIGTPTSRYRSCFTPLEGHDDALAGGEALYVYSAAAPPLDQTDAQPPSADDPSIEAPDAGRFGAANAGMKWARHPALTTTLAVLLVLVLAVVLRQSLDSDVEQVETQLSSLDAGRTQSSEQAPSQELPAEVAAPLASAAPDRVAGKSTAKSASLPVAPAGSAPGIPDTADSPEPPPAREDAPAATAKSSFGAPAQTEPNPSATVARAAPLPAQTRRQPAATGAVRFFVVPWGEIYVDGKRLGAAPPLRDIALQPGTHRIEVRNPGFAAHSVVIEVRAGEETRIRHRFE